MKRSVIRGTVTYTSNPATQRLSPGCKALFEASQHLRVSLGRIRSFLEKDPPSVRPRAEAVPWHISVLEASAQTLGREADALFLTTFTSDLEALPPLVRRAVVSFQDSYAQAGSPFGAFLAYSCGLLVRVVCRLFFDENVQETDHDLWFEGDDLDRAIVTVADIESYRASPRLLIAAFTVDSFFMEHADDIDDSASILGRPADLARCFRMRLDDVVDGRGDFNLTSVGPNPDPTVVETFCRAVSGRYSDKTTPRLIERLQDAVRSAASDTNADLAGLTCALELVVKTLCEHPATRSSPLIS